MQYSNEYQRSASRKISYGAGSGGNALRNRQVQYNRTNDSTWTSWLSISVVVLMFGIVLYQFIPALAVLAAVIGINVLIEYHKWFTVGWPLDFEILYVGTAYLSAMYGFWWAVPVIVLGPIVSEVARGKVGRELLIKSAGLIATAVVAAAMVVSGFTLLVAVVVGLFVQYLGAFLAYNCSAVHNTIRRTSTALFAAYILFFLLRL